MRVRERREPRFTIDPDGQKVVLVPLANYPAPARILLKDFEALARAGVSDQWTLNGDGRHRYVRCHADRPGRPLLTVARCVARAGAKEVVRYQDGNPLNLRSDNLVMASGRAKGRERAVMNGEAVSGSGPYGGREAPGSVLTGVM